MIRWVLGGRGVDASRAGRHDEALKYLRKSYDIVKRIGSDYRAMLARTQMVDLFLSKGDYRKAEAMVSQCLPVAEKSQDQHSVARIQRQMGELARVRGDYARAVEMAQRALEIYGKMEDVPCAIAAFFSLAHTLMDCGDLDRACRLYGAARALQEHSGITSAPSVVFDLETELKALGTEERKMARLLVQEGAALTFRQAVGFALDIDAEADGRDSARSSPAATDRADSVRPGGLTEREFEVANLVAQGLTDREIAAELFISRHTVDSHLRNIFRKLDIPFRSALAAWAARHGARTTA